MLLFLRSSHIMERTFEGICSKPDVPLNRGQDLFLPVSAIPDTLLILEMARSSFITASVWVIVRTT